MGYTTANTLALPVPSTAGLKFLIINNTQGPITVNNASAALIITVNSGTKADIIYNAASTTGWTPITYGGVTVTPMPLMVYAPDMSNGNITCGSSTPLTVLQMYNTINCYGNSHGSGYIYLPTAANLITTAGTSLTSILGYTPPVGFTFFTYILVITGQPQFYTGSSNGYTFYGPSTYNGTVPYVYMLVSTVMNSTAGSEAYNVLSNYSI